MAQTKAYEAGSASDSPEVASTNIGIAVGAGAVAVGAIALGLSVATGEWTDWIKMVRGSKCRTGNQEGKY